MSLNFPIIQRRIASPDLPKTPYRNGTGHPEGVVFHSTENPGRPDTAAAEAAYEARTWQQAFVHYFVDDTSIVQTADANYVAWGCGPAGNARFVQIELCMIDNPVQFKLAYDRYVWLGAKTLQDFGLAATAAPTGTIWSHADVTKFLGSTDHADPIGYLEKHGVSWAAHILAVQREWDVQCRNYTLRRGDKGARVRRLQQLLLIGVDGDFGVTTEAAVRSFQQLHQLAVDGIVGPLTWDKLLPSEVVSLPPTPPIPTASGPAKDVPVDSQWAKAVQFVLENKLLFTYGDGTFRVDQPMTRGQVAVSLMNLYYLLKK